MMFPIWESLVQYFLMFCTEKKSIKIIKILLVLLKKEGNTAACLVLTSVTYV